MSTLQSKIYIATLISTFLILAAFKLFFMYNCYILLVPLIVLVVIASSFIELKLKHRSCSYRCYFNEESRLFKLFSSPYLITFFLLIYSVGLTFTIFAEIIFFTNLMWIYLALHVGMMVLIYDRMEKMLASTVKLQMHKLLAREFSIKIGSVILFGVMSVMFYYSDTPSYIASTLAKSIHNATNSIGSDCMLIDYLARLKVELNTAIYWGILNITQHIDSTNNKLYIWLIFILVNSLSAIGINRLIGQNIYLIEKIIGKKQCKIK